MSSTFSLAILSFAKGPGGRSCGHGGGDDK